MDINSSQLSKLLSFYNSNLLPSSFSNFLVQSLNTRGSNRFYIPFCRTNIEKFYIIYQGTVFLQKLSSDIRNALSLYSFQSKIKNFCHVFSDFLLDYSTELLTSLACQLERLVSIAFMSFYETEIILILCNFFRFISFYLLFFFNAVCISSCVTQDVRRAPMKTSLHAIVSIFRAETSVLANEVTVLS